MFENEKHGIYVKLIKDALWEICDLGYKIIMFFNE